LASFAIGAKLRRERVGKGLAIDDIARDTRIAPRFLEAIETDDYSSLPGLVFTRNFIRQYALILKLDPDPLLAELPKQDESTAPLPNPPAHPRSSYRRNRRLRSLVSSVVWLLVAGAGVAAYIYFHHSLRVSASQARSPQPRSPQNDSPQAAAPVLQSGVAHAAPTPVEQTPAVAEQTRQSAATTPPADPSTAAPVQVSVTAHERAWVQVSVDGKTTFIGTLTPNETKEVAAAEQVKVLTGNAGALTISLNGKTLDSLGSRGQMREVRLTAEGPQFLSKDHQPSAPAPL
jgi:cytoskeletal protein RodZ